MAESATVVESTKVLAEDQVASVYRQRSGYRRKIIHLWGSFYRVNYHRMDDNFIESYFVELAGDKVIPHESK